MSQLQSRFVQEHFFGEPCTCSWNILEKPFKTVYSSWLLLIFKYGSSVLFQIGN